MYGIDTFTSTSRSLNHLLTEVLAKQVLAQWVQREDHREYWVMWKTDTSQLKLWVEYYRPHYSWASLMPTIDLMLAHTDSTNSKKEGHLNSLWLLFFFYYNCKCSQEIWKNITFLSCLQQLEGRFSNRMDITQKSFDLWNHWYYYKMDYIRLCT